MRQTIAIYPWSKDSSKLEANIWIPRGENIEPKRVRKLVPSNVYAHLKTEPQRLKAANQWAVSEILRLQQQTKKAAVLNEAQPITVDEFHTQWLDRLRAKSQSEAFLHNIEKNYVTHIQPAIGHLCIQDVTQKVCDGFVLALKSKTARSNPGRFKRDKYEAMRRKGKSLSEIALAFRMTPRGLLRAIARKANKPRQLQTSTQRTILNCLGSLLTAAYEYGYLKLKPKLLYPAAQKNAKLGRTRYYDSEQFSAIMSEAARFPGLQLAELLGAEAGLRRCEILAVHGEDYDRKTRRLTIQRQLTKSGLLKLPKNEHRRTLKATPRLHAALIAAPQTGRLFQLTARRLNSWQLTVTTRAAKHCPSVIPSGSIHKLRHTFATRIAQKTGSAITVARACGHESVETSMQYIHDVDVDGAIDLISEDYEATQPAKLRRIK